MVHDDETTTYRCERTRRRRTNGQVFACCVYLYAFYEITNTKYKFPESEFCKDVRAILKVSRRQIVENMASSGRRKCSRLRRIWRRVTTDRLSVFLVGFLIGVLLAVLAHYSRSRAAAARAAAESGGPIRPYDFAYELWLAARGMESAPIDPDIGR